jgi:hypothetical protein
LLVFLSVRGFFRRGDTNIMPLTDTAIRNARARLNAYKLSDGGGLYLLVAERGGKLWRLSTAAQ